MDKFNNLEELEELFKKINCYGQFNYCFSCQLENSTLPILFGALGVAISTIANKKVMGYLLNQNNKGICLIPTVADTLTKNKVDIENYIFIKQSDIKNISIKNEDFVYKKIKIILNDKTKYILKTIKRVKNVDYHEQNLNKFINMYNRRGSK